MKIESFTDIESWKLARELVKDVYTVTKNNKFAKDYRLKDQIQRAVVSIMSNIAEGFDSNSNKTFINFMNYSYRSASEVESLLYVALDLEYITKTEFDELKEKVSTTKKLIGGFIKYLKSTSN
ncbi:MAG: four helix bundle protein [Melioribacter sp.]|uniref:four helix bundle protein n=1 Tax=Melioribacter sp. TaxID=2052167 RepID=UPI003BDC61F9